MTLLLGADAFGQLMMAAAVVLLAMILFVNVRRRLADRQRHVTTSCEKIEQAKQVSGMRNDMRNMMVELDDMARHFAAQLDAKAIHLEKLLEEAEEKIRRLEGGGSAQESASAKTARRSAGARSPQAKASTGVGVTESREAAKAATRGDENEDLTERVYRLADEGRGAVDIARELEEHVGKVELILALRGS